MKKIIILFLIFPTFKSFSQVGIGTNTPANSAMLEVSSNDKGFLLPRMSSAQRTSISSPANLLQMYDTNTNSIWYFNGTYWVNTLAMASAGDVKSGVQSADHSGWILLDGRALSTLSANQQAVAITLGFSGNLPNANNAYLVQNGGTIGSTTGSNTTILTQANLPNVTFNGTAANAGSHAHTASSSSSGNHAHTGATSSDGDHIHTGSTSTNGNHSHTITPKLTDTSTSWQLTGFGFAGFTNAGTTSTSTDGDHLHSLNINSNGTHAHTLSTNTTGAHTHSVTVDTSGDHGHSVSVSSGGSGTPVNIAPKSLTVNMFIYLGL